MERPLRAYLASLGAPAHQIDDLVQETAARALERAVPYEDAADLRRWCFVVARHAWVDEVRRAGRSAPLDHADGQHALAVDDALRRVEDRHVLRQIGRALPGLREADRNALMSRAGSEPDAGERNRRNVARHRARARLRLVIGPLAGAGALPFPACLRRLWRAAPLTVAPAIVALGAIFGSVPTPGSSSVPPEAAVLDVLPRPGAVSIDAPPAVVPTGTATRGRELGSPVHGRPAPTLPEGSLPSEHPRVAVTAPAGTHVSVVRDEQEPGEPLICLDGDLVNACLDLPAPVGVPHGRAR